MGTARGGTGITTNPSLLVNLASTAAASVFAASPRPGVTGTLPVARGGTGVTSLDGLKTALGISPDQITYFSKTVTATTKNRTVTETITIPGTIKFVVLLTCYYSGGATQDVNYRIAYPSVVVDSQHDYVVPVSNIFVPTSSAILSTCMADGSVSSNLGLGYVGPCYSDGWNAGEINVTTTEIALTAYAAEGSSSSGRTTGNTYFSGLVWYS